MKQKLNSASTGPANFKITAYANNPIVDIGAIEVWTTLTNLLSKYKAAVNAAVNKEKTKLLPPIKSTLDSSTRRGQNRQLES
ncbi:40268_t:CDS:1 [Gigaspora margarita]|uniref:40268_t:CDS:1 n=1 Tax=Gigaspora margarita TaxID=4874 RepID=A0ABN7WIH0_GIGMA|nr:40268_t:CDS:1 [Gigaspora margarita]